MHTMNTTALEAFMDHLEHTQRRSMQTVRTYRYTLNYWMKWLDEKGIDDVQPEDVEAWARRERRGGKRPSAHTMRREIVIVRTFQRLLSPLTRSSSMRRANSLSTPLWLDQMRTL